MSHNLYPNLFHLIIYSESNFESEELLNVKGTILIGNVIVRGYYDKLTLLVANNRSCFSRTAKMEFLVYAFLGKWLVKTICEQ